MYTHVVASFTMVATRALGAAQISTLECAMAAHPPESPIGLEPISSFR